MAPANDDVSALQAAKQPISTFYDDSSPSLPNRLSSVCLTVKTVADDVSCEDMMREGISLSAAESKAGPKCIGHPGGQGGIPPSERGVRKFLNI